MPTAPTYGPQRANIAAVPGVRQDANRTPQEYGADFGGVVQAAGKLGEEVYVNQSILRAQKELSGLNSDLDTDAIEYSKLRGEQARGLSGKATENLQKRLEARRQALQDNPVALKAFDSHYSSIVSSYSNKVNSHEAGQVFEADSTNLAVAVSRDKEVAANLAGTPMFDDAVAKVEKSEIERLKHQGVEPGLARDQAKLMVPKVKSQSVDMALAEKNVAEAKRRFDLLQTGMLAEDRSRLKGELEMRLSTGAAEAAVVKATQDAALEIVKKVHPVTGVAYTVYDMTEADIRSKLDEMKLSPEVSAKVPGILNERWQQIDAANKKHYEKIGSDFTAAVDMYRSAARAKNVAEYVAQKMEESPSVKNWFASLPLERQIFLTKHWIDGPVLRSAPSRLEEEARKLDADSSYTPVFDGINAADAATLRDRQRSAIETDLKVRNARIASADAVFNQRVLSQDEKTKFTSHRYTLQQFALNNKQADESEIAAKLEELISGDPGASDYITPRDIPGAIRLITSSQDIDHKRKMRDKVMSWHDTYRALKLGGDNPTIDQLAPSIIDGAGKSWGEYKRAAAAKYTNPIMRDSQAFELAFADLDLKNRTDWAGKMNEMFGEFGRIISSTASLVDEKAVDDVGPPDYEASRRAAEQAVREALARQNKGTK